MIQLSMPIERSRDFLFFDDLLLFFLWCYLQADSCKLKTNPNVTISFPVVFEAVKMVDAYIFLREKHRSILNRANQLSCQQRATLLNVS